MSKPDQNSSSKKLTGVEIYKTQKKLFNALLKEAKDSSPRSESDKTKYQNPALNRNYGEWKEGFDLEKKPGWLRSFYLNHKQKINGASAVAGVAISYAAPVFPLAAATAVYVGGWVVSLVMPTADMTSSDPKNSIESLLKDLNKDERNELFKKTLEKPENADLAKDVKKLVPEPKETRFKKAAAVWNFINYVPNKMKQAISYAAENMPQTIKKYTPDMVNRFFSGAVNAFSHTPKFLDKQLRKTFGDLEVEKSFDEAVSSNADSTSDLKKLAQDIVGNGAGNLSATDLPNSGRGKDSQPTL